MLDLKDNISPSNEPLQNERLFQDRITRRRIDYAKSVNPAAALIGESQVGKGYVADALLSSESSPLRVYDGYGKSFDFLKEINPIGGGREATALITRFTTKKVWVDADFPVKCLLLSPIDIVCILVNGYYNHLRDIVSPTEEEVKAELKRLKTTYNGAVSEQDVIGEDEIYELKEYFNSGELVNGEEFCNVLTQTNYFERLGKIIKYVPILKWGDVFSFLWRNEPTFTQIFEKLIQLLRKFHFSKEVYTNIDSLLRLKGTILHADRLFDMVGSDKYISLEKEKVDTMVVLIPKGNILENVPKGVFSALTMEVDFTIDVPANDNEDDDSALVKEKPFLKHLDILDFPGLHAQMRVPAYNLPPEMVANIFLRAKTVYLFYKYSTQFLITNLLFCHPNIKSEVPDLGKVLDKWVEQNIGATPKERESFLAHTHTTPLFIISTKLNIDLARHPEDSYASSREELNKMLAERWLYRFGCLQDILNPYYSSGWFDNWTESQKYFDNLYLIRSFYYSGINGVYEGYLKRIDHPRGYHTWEIAYDENGKKCGETKLADNYVQFLKDLYQTFKNDVFVRNHFPQECETEGENKGKLKAWVEVTEPGKDGSAWIIENLSKSAENMARLRDDRFERILSKIEGKDE